jgi:hypothetical protein
MLHLPSKKGENGERGGREREEDAQSIKRLNHAASTFERKERMEKEEKEKEQTSIKRLNHAYIHLIPVMAPRKMIRRVTLRSMTIQSCHIKKESQRRNHTASAIMLLSQCHNQALRGYS